VVTEVALYVNSNSGTIDQVQTFAICLNS